ncbi:MAG: site-specific integrase [Actinomycetota bacterium]|nr:site-specific integrase [Actinomycetota bacterium]
MASITKVPTGWRARYRAPDGGSRSRTFPRKVDAERFLITVEASKLTGAYVDPSAGRLTFGAYAEQWRASQVHRPSTAARVETVLRCHVLPQLGARPVGAIRTSELQAWVKGRSEILAPSTLRTLHQTVVAIFSAAVADRLIPVSPTVGVKLPRAELDEVVPMAPEQVRAMAEAVPVRYRALIVAGAATGLRQGEALGLTVDRVDFLRRTIRVDRQLVTVSGQAPYLAPPKTPSSTRTIPAPQVALDALAAHLASFEPGPAGLVFTDDDGQAIRRPHIGHTWRKAARRAGVEGRSFHDLRHLCASVLIARGASVKSVQRFLGHASAKVTLDTYAHLWPDDEDRTRAALDDVLGPAVSPACHVDAQPG